MPNLCLVGCTIILVVVAISGPLYAFVLVSCVSTKACTLGTLLHSMGATCAEGGIVESMMHGDRCRIQCPPGLTPTQPELVCDDGDTLGALELRCLPTVVYYARGEVGGIVEGAVTEGELENACRRARGLQCPAVNGGSAILLQMGGEGYNLNQARCTELLEECRELNPAFEWGQYVAPPGSTTGDSGTCTLGCFAETLSGEDLAREEALREQRYQTALAELNDDGRSQAFAVNPEETAIEACDEGPICVHVNNSCNEGDNGDYYRYPICATRMTQWVKEDVSQRLRYDGSPQYSMTGKWILEKITDPMEQGYGIETARQPYFGLTPLYGSTAWDLKCMREVDAFTTQITYRTMEVQLSTCSCTDEGDCSGNGRAIGDKESGPNCACLCREGYAGDHCEIRMCEAPTALNANIPSCMEGQWIMPNGTCTPRCMENFAPNAELFMCGMNGITMYPSALECRRVPNIANMALEAARQETGDSGDTGVAIPTAPPICTDFDCSFKGEPTGFRHEDDGTCECVCEAGYIGRNCRTPERRCRAPLYTSIENSNTAPCQEGLLVTTEQCTAQCADNYFPSPPTLDCHGDQLDPPTFRCFGGESFKKTWCATMQVMSIVTSCVCFCALLVACFFYSRPSEGREEHNFVKNGQVIEIDKFEDDDGKYKVIRMVGRPQPDLPKAVRQRGAGVVQQAPLSIDNIDNGEPAPALRDAARDHHPRRQLGDAQPAATSLPGALQLQDGASVSESVESEEPYPGAFIMAELQELQAIQEIEDEPPPEFYEGQQIFLCGLLGHTALNGVYGTLVEYDEVSERWVVDLEGIEELKQVPEKNMQPVTLSIEPQNQEPQNTDWLMQMREIELSVQKKKAEKEAMERRESMSAELELAAKKAAELKELEGERAEVERLLRDGLRTGDAPGLKQTCVRARALLDRLSIQSAAERAGIIRLLQVAESRLEQYDARQATLSSKREHEERIARGEAPDWNMTPDAFWKYAENCDVDKVKAGLRARQPLTTRSKDGKRLTILHIVARGACRDADDEDKSARRVEVIKALLEAKASANAIDVADRTPLDLAVCEGGPGAKDSPILQKLRELGLMDSRNAAEEVRRQSQASVVPPSILGSTMGVGSEEQSAPPSPFSPSSVRGGRRGFGLESAPVTPATGRSRLRPDSATAAAA